MPLAFLCQPSALRDASLNETVLFALPAARYMPWSELLSLVLWVTSDDVVPESWMPLAVVVDEVRTPALVTVLLEMVMLLDEDTEMPAPVVSVTVNPLTTM